jgi:hypothetical protein
MSHRRCIPAVLIVLLAAAVSPAAPGSGESSPARAGQASSIAYLGFDRNIYPGDEALPLLRKTFSFTGYWLSPPPEEKANTWRGKRALLRSHGFGFAVLYRARAGREINSEAAAKQKGILDARNAAASAKTEGFDVQTLIFLDIEEGGRLSAAYHAYLGAWADELVRGGFRAGVYCSGIPVEEAGGTTIVTADDIRNHMGARDVTFWIFNDVCPPSPGCSVPQNPPPVSASGVPYAAIWQSVRSPRQKEFTARCATTYHADGNCYAPGDTAHALFLDVDIATSSDPSRGVGKKPQS